MEFRPFRTIMNRVCVWYCVAFDGEGGRQSKKAAGPLKKTTIGGKKKKILTYSDADRDLDRLWRLSVPILDVEKPNRIETLQRL